MSNQESSSRKFHFISGLPQSGSTLTAALLRQNPRFHSGMPSPAVSLFEGVVRQFSDGNELSKVSLAQRTRILRGLFESYYDGHEQPVIFDTIGSWTAGLSELMNLFPAAKMICTVRDVAWVMDSLARQFRDNAFDNTSRLHRTDERSFLSTRIGALAGANRLIGYPWHALREACYSDFADRLILVDYDLLAARPAHVFKKLYAFLGEKPFEHSFESVEYDAPEVDSQLDGLLQVHEGVDPRPRETILPPELFDRYSQLSFWRDLPNSATSRIVAEETTEERKHTLPPSLPPAEHRFKLTKLKFSPDVLANA